VETAGLTDRLTEVVAAVAFERLVWAEEEVNFTAKGKGYLQVNGY